MNGDQWARRWLPASGAAIGGALIAIPLLALAIRALLVWSGDGWPYLSAGNFIALLGDDRFGGALVNTAIASLFTTVFSLILGFTLAFLVCRTDMPGRRVLGAANLLPFFLSPYVGATAWTWLLAQHDGLLPTYARQFGYSVEWLNIYSVCGVIFVLTLFHTPIAYLFAVPAMRELDAAFEDTARVHGASFWYALRHITLPMLMPALSSAALIVFITSAGSFDVPFVLGFSRGISFAPTEIYTMTQEPSGLGRAAAFGIVVLAATALLTIWRRRMPRAPRFIPTIGKPQLPRTTRLGWAGRVTSLLLEIAYIGTAVLLPLMAMLTVSFTKLWSGRLAWRTWNIANYHYVLNRSELSGNAIYNTVVLAIVGATIGIVLAVPQGLYLTCGNPHLRTRVENILSWPPGIPGIILGLGYLILASHTPLLGSFGIILLAWIARGSEYSTRAVTAVLLAINPELGESARASGGNWSQTMRHIVMPMLRWPLAASWLMLFAVFMRELGATILLYARGTETISVAMVVLSDSGPAYVAVLGVVQLMILLLAFLLVQFSRAPLIQRPAGVLPA